MDTKKRAIIFAILAAMMYGVHIPFAKGILAHVSPTMMAAFLYLGAGVGLMGYRLLKKKWGRPEHTESLSRKELPFVLGMIFLDIAAPIFLMLGIVKTGAADVSLLGNLEIATTAIIALALFKERISVQLWVAIAFITVAGMLLSFQGGKTITVNQGAIFVIAACICWGLENNCTRMISNKSSMEIVIIKGIFSGSGSLMVALILGESFPSLLWIGTILFLGFLAYGLSLNLYIMAQKELGAAKTSAYYAMAPFIGVFLSMVLGERPGIWFWLAMILMVISTLMIIKDSISLFHTHAHRHLHTHPHRHGDLIHTHEHLHHHNHQHVHLEAGEVHDHDDENHGNHDHVHSPSEQR